MNTLIVFSSLFGSVLDHSLNEIAKKQYNLF